MKRSQTSVPDIPASPQSRHVNLSAQRAVECGSADDAAFVLGNAETVVIVPCYGLAVARAQHAVKERAAKLTEKGVTVKYAIYPVAGRMPGHMNVLLAEAEVPYDQAFEVEDINGEFGQADVAIIFGANDVVDLAARTKGSPIYGMPLLEAYKAKTAHRQQALDGPSATPVWTTNRSTWTRR